MLSACRLWANSLRCRKTCASLRSAITDRIRREIDNGFRCRTGRLAPPASVHVSAGLLRDGATVIRRGRGVIVKNDRDRESIEAAAGLWCVNVGHGCREIVHAAAKQMNELAFFHTFNDVANDC